jgi:ribosomal protein S18 acetylase RimI-like enzyme
VIRPARADDADALRALDAETWSPLVSPGPPPDAGRLFFGAGLEPGDVLVAEVDGAVAGYAALGTPTPLESNRHVAYVRGLAVSPAHRGQGVGRALVEAAAAAAVARGARRLTLRVLAPNTAARALYESCGFAVEGVLRGEFRLEGRYVDDVLMARELPAGPLSEADPAR